MVRIAIKHGTLREIEPAQAKMICLGSGVEQPRGGAWIPVSGGFNRPDGTAVMFFG